MAEFRIVCHRGHRRDVTVVAPLTVETVTATLAREVCPACAEALERAQRASERLAAYRDRKSVV